MSLRQALTDLPAWRRNQYVTVAMVFVVFTGFAFVLPFLPLYVRALGVADESAVALWSGVLIGVAPLIAGLLAPVWGRLADRHGHRPMALRALSAYVVLLVLSALVTDVRQLLVLRVLVGVFGGIGPLGLAMSTALAPREQTGHAVGLVQSAQILSAAVGPFAGGFLADLIGIRATFGVTAVACLGALVLVVRFYEEAPRAHAHAPVSEASAEAASAADSSDGEPRDTRSAGAPPAPASSFFHVMRLPHMPAVLVTLFLVNFVGRSFTPILPLYLHELGAPEARLALLTGVLISAYSIAAAISASSFGRATRRRSPRTLLLLSLVGGALTVLPMGLAPGVGAFILLAVLVGLSSGGALTLSYTIGGLAVPERVRTTAFGFFSAAALFGGAVSPSVAGLLARFDLRGIFYLDAALFALLAAALVPALRGVGTPGEPAST
jgi:MFS family permease